MRKSILRIEHPPHRSSDRGADRLKRPGWVKIETILEPAVYNKKNLSFHSISLKFILFVVVF
ncbi:MAG TPA: hypothetical protein VEM15_12280, partial [Thermodesulfobacteriota bacterium]|nr:hypothetical protein [Thermodesulfobacteriota bacterium]